MNEPKVYSFDLIEPLRFKVRQRILLQITLVFGWLGFIALGIFLSLHLKAYIRIEISAVINVILSFYLMNQIVDKFICKTRIIGQLTINEDLLTAEKITIDLKKANKIILSNYIREGRLHLPKWKISDRLEIELPEKKNIIFYVCIFSKQNKETRLSDVLTLLRIKNKDYFGKIQLKEKYDFTKTD